MPVQNCIKVCITVGGNTLKEYQHQESGPEKDCLLTRFVEASTDKPFEIKVTLLRNYAFRSASFVEAVLYIDDDETPWQMVFDKKRLKHRQGVLSRPNTESLASVVTLDKQSGSWEQRSLTFGELKQSKTSVKFRVAVTASTIRLLRTLFDSFADTSLADTAEAPKIAHRNLRDIGSIRVVVYRASRASRYEPQDPKIYMFDALEELPEQSMKGLFVNKNVKLAHCIALHHFQAD
jgi:hypothetical protein